MQSQKWQNDLCFQGKPFNITVIQAYAPTSNAEEAEVEQFYEDLQDLLELIPPKDVLFIIGDWNAKVGSQEIPGVTGKFGLGIRNEVRQRLIKFCQENALVIANSLFQQHKRRLCTWTSPDGRHRNQIDYILCSQRWSLLKLTSIELVMPSSHLVLGCPLLLLPPICPSIRVFSNESTFPSGGQRTGASALGSLLPKKSQGWSPSEWTGWISLQSKGHSRVFSNTTVQKHQFFGAQPSSQSNSHIHTWPQENHSLD